MNKVQSIQTTVIVLLFLIGTVGYGRTENESDSSQIDLHQQLDQRIPRWMERYEVPGVTIAVIKNGEINWSDAYGFADISNQIRMKPETVCRVESISKSVTACGVMKLVEMGKIQLDDPVYLHLKSWEFPESDYETKKVTIRQLLSHSSGLHLGTIGLEYAPQEEKPSLRESLSREVRFSREPGSKFNYSNVGYHLLELLIEDVTEKDFSKFMENEILLPLEMVHSSFKWSEDFITPVPNGYNLNGEPVPVYVYSEKGAGGLFASVEDIAGFVTTGMLNEFYSTGNILTQNSVRELYSPVSDVAGIYSLVADHYGLGHFIETLPNGQMAVFSGGQGNGWMTHFHLVPETGDGIVILTNSSRSWPLISHILSDWAEWNGVGSVGMEIITKATTALWILIFIILASLIFQVIWVIWDYKNGKRQVDFNVVEYSGLQYVQLSLIVILISVFIWSITREYLMITSVFPGVSGWLMFTLFLVAMVMLITTLIPKDGRDQTKQTNFG